MIIFGNKKNWSKPYFDWLLKYRHILNVCVLIITVLCGWAATKLELRTNFSELLPNHLQSVKSLKEAAERIGGTGLLLIGVEGPDFESNRKFIEAMAQKIQPMVGHQLRFFEYRYSDVQDYIEKYGLHYLTLEKLKKLEDRLTEEIDRNKDKALGLGLEDEEPETKTSAANEWMNDLDPQMRLFLRYRDAYLSADEGKVMVMALRPFGSSLSVDESSKLVRQIQDYINELNPKSFHPQMQVNLGGSVQSAIQEFQTIRSDIVDTALLLVALILAILFLFFWSFRIIILLVANLVFAVAWTFALTKFHIGYLNTQTAFLGSLVVGTGINYGVIFIYRFQEIRRNGVALKEAISDALGSTAIATLIASSSTAVSFLCLLIAQNKGLSQFGFIGCIGVVFCWIAAYSILPLWLYQWESHFPTKSFTHPIGKFLYNKTVKFGNWVTRRASFVTTVLILTSLIGLVGVIHILRSPIEYNFDNLRNKVAATEGTEAVERRINKVFNSSLTPSLVLLDNLDQAKEFCPTITALAASLPPDENIIQSCMSIYELLPKDLPEAAARRAEMLKVKKLLDDRTLRFSDQWEKLRNFKEKLTLEKPTLKEVPPQLARRFTEKNGSVGTLAFVNPNSDKPLNDGRNLLAFTNSLQKIELKQTGTVVSAAGDSFILADLLRGLKKDGPITSAIALIAVIIIAALLAGGFGSGILMTLCLAVGTWWMLGFQGFMDIKYNFFNFIALPLTFGIGIDYPINIYVRAKQENFQNFGKVLATSGTAVILCSLTTIIGYYTLIGATNLALVSFAKLALIGEVTCLIAAIVLLPVLLVHRGRFKTPA